MLWNNEQNLSGGRLCSGGQVFMIHPLISFYEDEKQIFKNNGIRDSGNIMYPLHNDTGCSLV